MDSSSQNLNRQFFVFILNGTAAQCGSDMDIGQTYRSLYNTIHRKSDPTRPNFGETISSSDLDACH